MDGVRLLADGEITRAGHHHRVRRFGDGEGGGGAGGRIGDDDRCPEGGARRSRLSTA